MGSGGKTELQREILLTWHRHPEATNKEIAQACDCSASYVSQVKNRFDDYSEFEAMMDRQDRELEQMFGGDIFAGQRGQASEIPRNSRGRGRLTMSTSRKRGTSFRTIRSGT